MILRKWWGDTKGQALTEYALIIAVVAILVIGALKFLGGSVNDAFQKAGDEIKTGTSTSTTSK